MSLEDNKRVTRRYFEELVGRANLALFDEIVAPNVVDEAAQRRGWTPGREGLKQHLAWFHNALPDVQITVDDLVAEEERVIAFWTFRGTHQGELWGVEPTHRHIVGRAITILRILNGQIIEYATRPDRLDIMLQLGSLGQYAEQLARVAV